MFQMILIATVVLLVTNTAAGVACIHYNTWSVRRAMMREPPLLPVLRTVYERSDDDLRKFLLSEEERRIQTKAYHDRVIRLRAELVREGKLAPIPDYGAPPIGMC